MYPIFIRIIALPNKVKALLLDKKISFGHARALLAAKDIAKMADIVQKKPFERKTNRGIN